MEPPGVIRLLRWGVRRGGGQEVGGYRSNRGWGTVISLR